MAVLGSFFCLCPPPPSPPPPPIYSDASKVNCFLPSSIFLNVSAIWQHFKCNNWSLCLSVFPREHTLQERTALPTPCHTTTQHRPTLLLLLLLSRGTSNLVPKASSFLFPLLPFPDSETGLKSGKMEEQERHLFFYFLFFFKEKEEAGNWESSPEGKVLCTFPFLRFPWKVAKNRNVL